MAVHAILVHLGKIMPALGPALIPEAAVVAVHTLWARYHRFLFLFGHQYVTLNAHRSHENVRERLASGVQFLYG